PPDPAGRELDLDLRQPNDLARSRLLHRLLLLGLPWGQPQPTPRGQAANSTFHERWRLAWQPELALGVIEASRYGNTVPEAATGFVSEAVTKETALPALTRLLERALPAELPGALGALLARLQAVAALASETGLLMDALPPLAQVQRYGNVRQTDTAAVAELVEGLLVRICIGLPGACGALNDEAAAEMRGRLAGVQAAVALLQSAEQQAAWLKTLARLADQPGLHGLLAGYTCRLLHEQGAWQPAEVVQHLQ